MEVVSTGSRKNRRRMTNDHNANRYFNNTKANRNKKSDGVDKKEVLLSSFLSDSTSSVKHTISDRVSKVDTLKMPVSNKASNITKVKSASELPNKTDKIGTVKQNPSRIKNSNQNTTDGNNIISKTITTPEVTRNSKPNRTSSHIISHEKIEFPNFTLFDDAPKHKRTRLPPPSELFRTERNSNYFNNTEEEILKEMEEAAAKEREQSVLYQLFKSLAAFKQSTSDGRLERNVDSFSNVSGLLEQLAIRLVSDKLHDTFSYDSFGVANHSFFKKYKEDINKSRYRFFWMNGFLPDSSGDGLEMSSLLYLFNEIPTKSTFYFKHNLFPLLLRPAESTTTSVKKAVLFSKFFKSIDTITNSSKIALLSRDQFNFFKTISSSIEIAILGNSTYSVLHSCKYNEDLPLKSFEEKPNFFHRLPNLLFLLFNKVFETTFETPSLLDRNTLVPYNTKTLIFNYISLGSTTIDTIQLANIRLTEQSNIAFRKKLSRLDNREVIYYFSRLELSIDLISKVKNLLLDTSTIGTVVNPLFLKLKQLNRDIFIMKEALALNPSYSSEFTTPKRNLSIWVLKKRWVVKLLKYNRFLKMSYNNIVTHNSINNRSSLVSVLEVFARLKEELESMVIRINKKVKRATNKLRNKNTALSSLNFENLFNRRRKKQYFLKFYRQKKLLKATVNSKPQTGIYAILKKKVSSTASMYTKLQNSSNSSFFYSLCLDRSRLLSKFRNHLIKKGLKLKATNSFLEILAFIKGTYRICPVKVLRFLLLRHYKATLVTELFIKKRKVFIPKQLSLRKQIYYMVFSFLKEASLRSNLKTFSYKINEKKTSRLVFSIENYIDSLMHSFLDGSATYMLEKNKLIEEKVYNTKHYLIPSSNNRSRLRKKFSLYSGH
jgi:hypothetical protein